MGCPPVQTFAPQFPSGTTAGERRAPKFPGPAGRLGSGVYRSCGQGHRDGKAESCPFRGRPESVPVGAMPPADPGPAKEREQLIKHRHGHGGSGEPEVPRRFGWVFCPRKALKPLKMR